MEHFNGYLEVGKKFHCLRCHSDYSTAEDGALKHSKNCHEEVTQCGKIEGKECHKADCLMGRNKENNYPLFWDKVSSQSDWETEFDEEFTKNNLRDDLSEQKVSNYIKSFIHKVEAQAYERGKKEVIAEMVLKHKSSVLKAITDERSRIKKDLLEIADTSELEDLRREVESYFSKLKE